MLGTKTPSVRVIASRGGPFLGRSPMDYLISSGGCPGVSGNLNNMYVHITEEQLHKYHEDMKSQFLEQLREYQTRGEGKMCSQRPKPTPAPTPKSQEIQVGQPVDLVWHYEKLVDRLEKEIERLTAELKKVRSE